MLSFGSTNPKLVIRLPAQIVLDVRTVLCEGFEFGFDMRQYESCSFNSRNNWIWPRLSRLLGFAILAPYLAISPPYRYTLHMVIEVY